MKLLSLLKYVGLAFIFCSVYQEINAQGFKGIVPIRSTCEDVQRILGGGGCGKSSETITLPNEEIKITYTTQKCQPFYGDLTRWNVPIGTVFTIIRRFKIPPTLEEAEMKINESEFIKTTNDIVGQVFYHKKNGEEVLTITQGYLNDIIYYPSDNDKSKACQTPKRNFRKKGKN